MNPAKSQPIKLGTAQVPIYPEQVKGSDGVYLTFTDDSKPDPFVRAAAIAILLQTAWVAAVVIFKVARRLR